MTEEKKKDQKQIHVHLDRKQYDEIMSILPFHGALSHVVRLSLRNFIDDVKSGKISLGGKAENEEG